MRIHTPLSRTYTHPVMHIHTPLSRTYTHRHAHTYTLVMHIHTPCHAHTYILVMHMQTHSQNASTHENLKKNGQKSIENTEKLRNLHCMIKYSTERLLWKTVPSGIHETRTNHTCRNYTHEVF